MQNYQRSKSPRQSTGTSPRCSYAHWDYGEQDEPWDGGAIQRGRIRQGSAMPLLDREQHSAVQRSQGNLRKERARARQERAKAKHLSSLPWSSQSKTANTAAGATTSATSTASQSKAEAKLQEIVSVLRKKEDPELQTLAEEASLIQSQNATSKLHKAVKQHGNAKEAVLDARLARRNLHVSWKNYLDAAISTWKEYIEVEQAEAELIVTAQEQLDEAKKVATEEELQEQVEVVDDDMDVSERNERSGKAISNGLHHMLEGLEKIQTQTEEAIDNGASKRQRLWEMAPPNLLARLLPNLVLCSLLVGPVVRPTG
eukprot:s50_g54.t1